MIKHAFFSAAALLLVGTANAQARPGAGFHHWYARLGPARAIFDEAASVTVDGTTVPGSSARLSDNWGIAAEGGYYLNPNISLSLTVGIPPTTTLSGAATLTDFGRLARISYGPAVAAVEYHLTVFDAVRPYVGAGINYTLVVRSRNLLLKNTHVDDTSGPAIVGGVELPVADRIALFADYKKIWASTTARFDLPTSVGPLAGKAKVKLDPSLLHAGLTYRF